MNQSTNKCPRTRTNFKSAPVYAKLCVLIYERIIKTAESENDSNEAILERLLDYAILVKGVSSQISEIDRDMLLDGLIKHILENSITESDVSRILSLKMTLLKNN